MGKDGGIAFVTMVRDEDLFLRIWVEYYSRFVPRAALIVLLDGLDQRLPDWAEGVQALRLPRTAPGPGWDAARWRMISAIVSGLTERHEAVVFNDVDELIALDPAAGRDLPGAIRAEVAAHGVVSPFALELVHRRDLEPPLDPARPVLDQRRHARINASYCKPCLTGRPIRWSLGGHYADHPRLHLSDTLFLFHLRYVDAGILMARQARRLAMAGAAADVAGGGWSQDESQMEAFLASIEARPPEVTDFAFGWQRRRIRDSWRHDEKAGIWRHDTLHNRRSYVLPDRFAGLF